jgi:ABC-2 type transport system ATP-binding protein
VSSDETGDQTVTPVITVTDLSLKLTPRHQSRWSRLRHRTQLVKVVDHLSFTIGPGEAVGYVGARGAAKTTLVDLITGATAPTGGRVRTCGLAPDTERERLARRIGVVSGKHSQLWQDLPLDESLRILARAHQLPAAQWLARRTDLVDRLELATFLGLSADQLSPGRRIRGELAAALIHEPELLILDEPTVGLDVISKERLRSFLRQENRVHGRTLLFTAGDLSDVEQICHRLLVVDHGRLVHDGDVQDLLHRVKAQRTLVVDLLEADRMLDDVPGTELIAIEAGGLRQRLSFSAGTIPTARVLADVAARTGIRHLTLEEPDLETLIQRL